MAKVSCELVVPDAGPLITLAYSDRLELLLALGIEVVVVDMVKAELTRHQTPTSQMILEFINENDIRIVETEIGVEAATQGQSFKKRHAGERAIQEFLFDFYEESERNRELTGNAKYALLLFEEHKIGGTSFVLPENVYIISTSAFLRKLEEMHVITSASEIREAAVAAGRDFSERDIESPPKANSTIKPF